MKTLVKIYCIVCTLVLVWMGASYLEVLCKNVDANPTYSSWNAFKVLYVDAHTYEHEGRYYTDGTVLTDDGNDTMWWEYQTDSIDADGVAVTVTFHDNYTDDDITDDIILKVEPIA